jgi:hypothetical protein
MSYIYEHFVMTVSDYTGVTVYIGIHYLQQFVHLS